jgi:Ca2+-binding EF-hand superfamily protein
MAKKLFEKADGDHDGKITKEELEAALPHHDSSEALDRLFSKTDADHDGSVSQSELEASLKSHVDQRSTSYAADGSSSVPAGPTFSRIA